jgi:hypothetical protein
MGWYFRKSVKFGPGRINFSTSGISYSFGVKGAGINTGPRGTYVSFGRGGIYYRRKIIERVPTRRHSQGSADQENGVDHTITSGAIETLTDSDSKDFIEELSSKAGKISYFRWFGLLPATLSAVFLLIFFLQTSRISEQKKAVVTIDSTTHVNIRARPEKAGKVLGTAVQGERFDALDTANNGWVAIKYLDSVAYVASPFAKIDSVTISITTYSRFQTQYKDFFSCLVIGAAFFVFLCVTLYKKDKQRLLIELYYEIDDHVQEVYGKFLAHFNQVLTSERIWQYLNEHRTSDLKHHAGAGIITKRVPVLGISPNRNLAKFFKTNISIPNIRLRNTDLYFLPERLVIKRGNEFAAVFYNHLTIESRLNRFIEDGPVPSDAKIIDRTWRYLNKNGTPDRRFNNNRQLPVCSYSEYIFSSWTGVYEIISTSKQGAFDGFVKFIEIIGKFQKAYNR